jgi:hypothetical protein
MHENQMTEMPSWISPKNIAKELDDGAGFWEDERWSPIQLIAQSGTVYNGRVVPIAWQIEFDPSDDEFEWSNDKLKAMGIEPDGYGWGEYIQTTVVNANPELANRCNIADCETDSCVIWVESPEDCRKIIEIIWRIVFNN